MLLMMFAPGNVVANHNFDESGIVPLGTPLIWEGVGISEALAACDPGSPFNGLDGMWFEIDGFAGHEFTLTMDDGSDYDIFFYDDGCNRIEGVGDCFMDLGLVAPFDCYTEEGEVPEGTAYTLVHNYVGVGGFRLIIE